MLTECADVAKGLFPGDKIHSPAGKNMHTIQSAMDVLLGVDFAVAEKDRLYRCLTGFWNISRNCSSICSSDGRICSMRSSTYCSTI